MVSPMASSLKLVGVQVVSLNTTAGVAGGNLGETEVAALFGQTSGFKAGEFDTSVHPYC
jgi:hypothetical protein